MLYIFIMFSAVQKKSSLLKAVGVTRQAHLSPDAACMYRQAVLFQNQAKQLKRKALSTRKRLQFLQHNQNTLDFLKDVNEPTANFFLSQQRTQKFKPRGRRFTIDDKILALSIYKQSGKGYRYLSKIFSLPSRKTLTSMLNKIPFGTGINKHIFDHLKSSVSKMSAINRYCVLLFDEISLETGLQYNKRSDFIEGFVDFGGSDRRAQFADHALLFMVRGIHKKWKQPVCFTFCEWKITTADLLRMVKDVIRQTRATGLRLVATICDQGATNRATINSLIDDSRRYCLENNIEYRFHDFLGYLIDGKEIVHLYDFPHLMKGIRNNLLDKNLHFVQGKKEKIARWSHIEQLYEMDKQFGQPYSQFKKLTDEHVVPAKIKKMRVQNCTQVFSHTVGTAMMVRAQVSTELQLTSKFYLDPQASDTADLLLFFDKLFDSVNGSSVKPLDGKKLRTAVTSKSIHNEFWNSCLPVLDSMHFSSPKSNNIITPSLKNWKCSLRGLMYLWKSLQRKGFKYLSIRNLNQDPV